MVDVCTPEGSEVTCELGVLEELQAVFNPEMAHASFIPFYCLIGETHTTTHIATHTATPRKQFRESKNESAKVNVLCLF